MTPPPPPMSNICDWKEKGGKIDISYKRLELAMGNWTNFHLPKCKLVAFLGEYYWWAELCCRSFWPYWTWGMMLPPPAPPKNMFLTTVLKWENWTLMMFNTNLWSIKKGYVQFPRLSGVTIRMSLSLSTRDFVKLLFHIFLITKF